METNFLTLALSQFEQYKKLGEKTLVQLTDTELHWQPSENCLSIATLIKHLHGNMLSRFTDFLTTDGEKPWRNRDDEFIADDADREMIMQRWNEGWNCVLETLKDLKEEGLQSTVFIRHEPNTAMQAICRQMTHYAYHVGQIVTNAKICRGEKWQTLSIAPGKTQDFNEAMLSKNKK